MLLHVPIKSHVWFNSVAPSVTAFQLGLCWPHNIYTRLFESFLTEIGAYICWALRSLCRMNRLQSTKRYGVLSRRGMMVMWGCDMRTVSSLFK